MANEMMTKKCKECGQLFVPKNPRQQYCDAKHFRPCPTCGKSIEIKYLSDPTPRCADCRAAGRKIGSKPITSITNELPENLGDLPVEYTERRYTGKSNFNFITNHIYLVKVKENRPYGFVVKAIRDTTDNEDVDDLEMPISSPLSFSYFFKEVG